MSKVEALGPNSSVRARELVASGLCRSERLGVKWGNKEIKTNVGEKTQFDIAIKKQI